MAESGILSLSGQEINACCRPTTSYASFHRSLPIPPSGLEGIRNPQTNEGSLLKSNAKSDIQGFPVDFWQNSYRGLFLPCPGQAIQHEVSFTGDTMQGICIKYGISAAILKKINRFSGHCLALAPSTLIVPITDQNRARIESLKRHGRLNDQRQLSRSQKVSALRAKARSMGPTMSMSEAKAYLELHNWDLNGAMKAAKQDIEEEQIQHHGLMQSKVFQACIPDIHEVDDGRNPETHNRDDTRSPSTRDPPTIIEIEMTRIWK